MRTSLRVLLALTPPLLTFIILWAAWQLFRPYAWLLFPATGAMLAAIAAREIHAARRSRRMSDEAEAAHQRMRSLFESAPEGIFIADLDGRFTDVNAAGCRMVGYPRDQLIGMMIADVIRPDDVERLDRQKQQLLTGDEIVGEWLMVRSDGEIFPAEVRAKILPDGRWQSFVRDMTRRTELEHALAAKSADLDRAQSVAQAGSWRLDAARNEIRWSDETYRIFDVPIGTPVSYEVFRDHVHPDDRAFVDRTWTAALAGTPYDIEHRALVAGQIKWVREKVELELDEHGSLLGAIGIAQDITERKRLEAEVHQAQERIELALNGAELAAWDWNVETGQVLLSARWAEMLGYSADEITPRVESWSAGIHPEDLPRVQQALDDHFASRTAEYECEFRVQTKSGEWIWILDGGKVFARDARGQPTRMLGTVLDITTRKRADTEQRFLADVGPILASTFDYEQTLEQVAQLAVRDLADLCVVDIVPIDGNVRRLAAACRDPVHGSIVDGLRKTVLDPSRPYLTRSAIDSREPLLIEQLTDETLASYAQGEDYLALLRALQPVSLIAVPLVGHGELLGAIAMVASVSSRRFGPADLRLAQELARRAALAIENARLYAVAQRAIHARDDVLGIVAHDLRNPLNAISLQAHMLRAHEGRDHHAGEALQRSVTRMNRLIEDILDVTRIEAGQVTVERQRVSTLAVVLEVVEEQRPLAEAGGLALLLDVVPDLPDICGDHDRLLQICENLIGNALKFTRHGSVTVGAASRDGEVVLWVRDTGCGIGPEVLPHVFDRFWKADKDTRRGAGLGLAIVKGLVEAHGGRIWAESTVGAGACFYFTIPKAPTLDTREAAALRQ